MKVLLCKLLLVTLLVPGLVHGHNDRSGKHSKEKKISREFQVHPEAHLKIDNSYGNVDISTWDNNTILIEVTIKTNGNDEEKVREKLESIDVEFSQSTAGVRARTRWERENSSWWSQLFTGSSNVTMEINYTIRAPETNSMEISNDYGGIFIDRLLGNARISCDYGRMDIQELHGDQNYLNFDYTRNSHIGFVNQAQINADYSEFEIEEAERLMINADYTTSKIRKVIDLEFQCDYGSMQVDKVQRLTGNGDYLSTRIGRVFGQLDLDLDYGNASIEKIVKGASNLTINSNYAGIRIGYDPTHSFDFDIETRYGNIRGIEDLEIRKRSEQNSRKQLQGFHLENHSGSTIKVRTSYANVQLIRK